METKCSYWKQVYLKQTTLCSLTVTMKYSKRLNNSLFSNMIWTILGLWSSLKPWLWAEIFIKQQKVKDSWNRKYLANIIYWRITNQKVTISGSQLRYFFLEWRGLICLANFNQCCDENMPMISPDCKRAHFKHVRSVSNKNTFLVEAILTYLNWLEVSMTFPRQKWKIKMSSCFLFHNSSICKYHQYFALLVLQHLLPVDSAKENVRHVCIAM